MQSARERLFGDLIKSVVKWEMPTLSVAYLAGLGFAGALMAFAGALAQGATPAAIDYVLSRRALDRKHALSYLVGLAQEAT